MNLRENKMQYFINIIKILKINHWLKNLIIFLPLLFSNHPCNITDFLFVTLVAIVFCLVSSAIYIFNDIKDIDTDKKHPLKKHRPLAAGNISVKTAWIIFFILFLIAAILSFSLTYGIILSILSYFLLNIIYSLGIKNIKYIDIICIALGFILRITAGAAAIAEPLPIITLLVVLCTSVFFTSIKRILEIQLISDASQRRQSIQDINTKVMYKILFISMLLSIALYSLMIIIQNTYQICLYITIIPFSLFILRIYTLLKETSNYDDPIIFLEKDKIIKILVIIFFLFCFVNKA